MDFSTDESPWEGLNVGLVAVQGKFFKFDLSNLSRVPVRIPSKSPSPSSFIVSAQTCSTIHQHHSRGSISKAKRFLQVGYH
jgi:hypothetical protein